MSKYPAYICLMFTVIVNPLDGKNIHSKKFYEGVNHQLRPLTLCAPKRGI